MVWGNTSKGLPWSSIQAGSQTTYAHTRANYATGMDFKKKLTEIAANFGGSPESYDTNDRGVIRKGGGVVLTWAKAAEARDRARRDLRRHRNAEGDQRDDQGRGGPHKGRGLMGVARDNLPRDGQTYGFMASFAEVEVDVETACGPSSTSSASPTSAR